eukprot:5022140-Pyramimonas_sp.AAC.1
MDVAALALERLPGSSRKPPRGPSEVSGDPQETPRQSEKRQGAPRGLQNAPKGNPRTKRSSNSSRKYFCSHIHLLRLPSGQNGPR